MLRNVVSRLGSVSRRGVSTKTTTDNVVFEMKKNKQHRAYLVYDKSSNSVKVSHPMFQELADSLQANTRDFHQHEAIFLAIGPKTDCLLSAVVHKTIRGQSAGGVRFWSYPTLGDFITDGLRLSRGMGHKNALAGLWHGGGKGVVARPSNPELINNPQFRQTLFREYGDFITSLRGCYVTAEDLGVTVSDVKEVFYRTRFTTCIPPELGGSGNPSTPTGHGVVSAMEGALAYMNLGSLVGKTVAVQGLGNVSQSMVPKLIEKGVKKIVGSDVNPTTVARMTELTRGASGVELDFRVVSGSDHSVLFEKADIVSPCAVGGTLNSDTIPRIQAKIVCGAANNQLLDDKFHDKMIQERGIVYVPDFLANRMGIVTCANEQYGYVKNDPAIMRHFDPSWDKSIYSVTQQVLSLSKQEKITTAQAAIRIAEELMKEPHPIWGHRSQQIINSLVEDRWHTLHH